MIKIFRSILIRFIDSFLAFKERHLSGRNVEQTGGFARRPETGGNSYLSYLTPNRRRLIGATSLEEQAYCEWYAAECYTGKGCIVEFGPWLGSLTVSTALGCIRNESCQNMSIYAYDLFLWELSPNNWVSGTPYERLYKPGESFKALYELIIAPFQGAVTIQVHQEDLSRSVWSKQPIEFMINDAWKTIPIMANTIRQFFPALLSGATVFHQDYLWTTEAIIHVGMFRLRNHFEFQGRLKNSCGVIFRKTSDLTSDTLLSFSSLTGFADLEEREIDEAFKWSAGLFSEPDARLVVKAGKAWLLHEMGQNDRARQLFASIKASEHYGHPFYQFQEKVLRGWGFGHLID